MRILVYGAGVLGGNLALNLYKAGKDVSLVARGEWAKTRRRAPVMDTSAHREAP